MSGPGGNRERRGADTCPGTAGPRAGEPVAITGLAALSAFGRGPEALLDGALAGQPAFRPVTRFDPGPYRAGHAAHLPGSPSLLDELASAVDDACTDAKLTRGQRAESGLLLAGRVAPEGRARPEPDGAGAAAVYLARGCELGGATRAYNSACVAGSTAVADAAAAIAAGRAERVVAVGGYLVDAQQFALFDAGRALAVDGVMRPFSTGRNGLLLGDAVAAVVLESGSAALSRNAPVLGWVSGWGRAGDAYHVCRPHPAGFGLARAIRAAMDRAGVRPAQLGYINAHGTATSYSDSSEATALHAAFGPPAASIPISSTKALHGHSLEASGLLELVLTLLALRAGRLPVNAGYLGPDESCRLDLVLGRPRALTAPYGLTVNSAFGGANTALVVRAA